MVTTECVYAVQRETSPTHISYFFTKIHHNIYMYRADAVQYSTLQSRKRMTLVQFIIDLKQDMIVYGHAYKQPPTRTFVYRAQVTLRNTEQNMQKDCVSAYGTFRAEKPTHRGHGIQRSATRSTSNHSNNGDVLLMNMNVLGSRGDRCTYGQRDTRHAHTV